MNDSNVLATDNQNSVVLDSVELKVKFDSGASLRSKALYGNGRMQVKVQVLVSGYDENGDPASVPADVLDTVELIHYNSGETLRNGWSASAEQGRFTLETAASPSAAQRPDDQSQSAGHPHVRTFWVSSSGVGTTQVAARISLNGNVIRSNGTGVIGRQDSSVTLDAQLPVSYSLEQFHLQRVRRGNEEPGNRIWNYYLGLDYQGQQIKLVDWFSSKGSDDVVFAYGNWVRAHNTNYLTGVLARPDKTDVAVTLPVNDNSLVNYIFRDSALDSSNASKEYRVRVNDRHGELTIVQALSEFAYNQAEYRADEVFYFSAIDQYGTEHKLAIRIDFTQCIFVLERG